MKKLWLAWSVLLLVSACQASLPASPVSNRPNLGVPSPAVSANLVAPYRDPNLPAAKRVDDLLSRMTLEEKIGQMTQVERNSLKPKDVTQNGIGSVLSGGDSLGDNSARTWSTHVKAFLEASQKTRLGIPLLYGIDAVHGHGHLSDATIFPQNIGLGATRDPDLVERIGSATAAEVAATGIRWNFAPVVAVPQDIRWGRTYEGYSENTELVTQLGTAYIKGLQALPDVTSSRYPSNVIATAKHFLADGGTAFGTSVGGVMDHPYLLDQGDARMDEATLRAKFLPPYKAAVDAGAKAVMVSFSSWNGVKMHANKHLITDVLKGELGFKGIVVSDWGGIDQIPGPYSSDVAIAINAGIDMVMVPYQYVDFIHTLNAAVTQRQVLPARIDDAVRRILTVKFEMGLFDQPLIDESLISTVGSAQHRALAREAVRKSLVLLQNGNQTLPLKKDAPVIFVAGAGANSTGYQSGGWTIEWQGRTDNTGSGTTILDAVKQTVSPTTRVEYNRFGNFESLKDTQGRALRANIGLIVLAEEPYAEGVGDLADLRWPATDLEMLARVKQVSERVVVIMLSGRPRVITNILPLTDAFIAAWLPGTEGAGITDVLFGDYEFTGKTPYGWPRSNAQLPFKFDRLPQTGCDAPLFPYGFGLTTTDYSPVPDKCPDK